MAARLKGNCEQLLGSRHAGERLLRCWGSGAGAVHEETRAAIRALLAEYASSHDGAEAARRLHLLAVPFFHHQLVKEVSHRPAARVLDLELVLEGGGGGRLGSLFQSCLVVPCTLNAKV